jgi:hypothetical protein
MMKSKGFLSREERGQEGTKQLFSNIVTRE